MINENYLKALAQIKNAFSKNGSVELRMFIDDKQYSSFASKYENVKTTEICEPLSRKHSMKKTSVPLEINAFIEKIAGKKLSNWELWSFSSGDYIVINDEEVEKPGIDIMIDLTRDWKEEFGGALVYVDGSGEYTKISAEANKLIIVRRKKGEHRFVQYVNHLARKNKRLFLIARV